MPVQIGLSELLGEIDAEASEAVEKQAALKAGAPEGAELLFNLSSDEIRRMADDIEKKGEDQAASQRILGMRKEAAESPQSGPSALDIYVEMRKEAWSRARRNLGLAPKTAKDTAAPILQLLFAGNSPLEKLSEMAAYYYIDRITNVPPRGES
jgi:hypothetical protein